MTNPNQPLPANAVVCLTCGYQGPPRSMGCGQIFILLFLSIFGLLPGILYAIYADSENKKCPSCQGRTLVPAGSPKGQEMLRNRPQK